MSWPSSSYASQRPTVAQPVPAKNRLANSIEVIGAELIEPELLEWLWPHYIPIGTLTLLVGGPGSGKTTLSAYLATTVGNEMAGDRWPDGSPIQHGNVIFWTGEDSVTQTIIPRLMAVRNTGHNRRGVYIINKTTANGRKRSFNPGTDLDLLKEECLKIGNVKLIILDPIYAVVTGNSNKNADVRKGLDALFEFAEELNCAIVGILHPTKSSKGKSPLDRVLGSVGFGAAPRMVLFTEQIKSKSQPDIPSQCVFFKAKTNIAVLNGGFIYHIETANVQTSVGATEIPRICWDGSVQGTPDEISKFAQGGGETFESDNKIDEAISFLQNFLANGAVPRLHIESQAEQVGISPATLKRAKQAIQARHYWKPGMQREPESFVWELQTPRAANRQFQNTAFDPVAPLGSFDSVRGINSTTSPFVGAPTPHFVAPLQTNTYHTRPLMQTAPVDSAGSSDLIDSPEAKIGTQSIEDTQEEMPTMADIIRKYLPKSRVAQSAPDERTAPNDPIDSDDSIASTGLIDSVTTVGLMTNGKTDEVDANTLKFMIDECQNRIRDRQKQNRDSDDDEFDISCLGYEISQEVINEYVEYDLIPEEVADKYAKLISNTQWRVDTN